MRTIKSSILILSLLIVESLSFAQTRATVERYVSEHRPEILAEFVSLLSIPNVASDKPNIRKNAEQLREMLNRRGFAVEILETDVNPLVYGELRVPGASRSILWYAHYDGQPFDAKLWKQESAFKPILRDGRMEDGAKDIPNFSSLKSYPPGARVYARCSRRFSAAAAMVDVRRRCRRLLASIEVAMPIADRTTISERAGELEQLIAVAGAKLRHPE